MAPKKVIKTFFVIVIVLACLAAFGYGVITFILNQLPSGVYNEDLSSHRFTDIVPITDYVDVWRGEERWEGLEVKPFNKEKKEEILSILTQMEYQGITKKEKNAWLGKRYPDNKNPLISYVCSFYPSKDAGGYIYGPESRKWITYQNNVPKDEYKSITNFHVIKEDTTGKYFLALYYVDANAKNERARNGYSYYLIKNDDLISKLDNSLKSVSATKSASQTMP